MEQPYSNSLPAAVITPWSRESIGGALRNSAASALFGSVSTVITAAGRVIYVPFYVSKPTLAKQLFVLNGSAVAGNIDVGIYSAGGDVGTRLTPSVQVAQAGVNSIQLFALAPDIQFGPGLFYLALVCSDAAATVFAVFNSNVSFTRLLGVVHQTLAPVTNPLPATAAFATATLSTLIPVCGIMVAQETL